mmetsp:Transcript_113710/g.328344  ORF Transcript_113710/g.328344 Transcript_113710/m.328344 type:complete len:233 (-) Transcript_113710:38-736(-)
MENSRRIASLICSWPYRVALSRPSANSAVGGASPPNNILARTRPNCQMFFDAMFTSIAYPSGADRNAEPHSHVSRSVHTRSELALFGAQQPLRSVSTARVPLSSTKMLYSVKPPTHSLCEVDCPDAAPFTPRVSMGGGKYNCSLAAESPPCLRPSWSGCCEASASCASGTNAEVAEVASKVPRSPGRGERDSSSSAVAGRRSLRAAAWSKSTKTGGKALHAMALRAAQGAAP